MSAQCVSELGPESVLQAYLERTSKFRKSWARRYVTFSVSTRKLTYAWEKDTPVKGTIVCTNITRFAELHTVIQGDGEYFALVIEGTAANGSLEKWTIRVPDEQAYNLWYGAIRLSLANASLMPPIDYGLPPVDPRNGLHFSSLPLEHLHRFILLEKAIMYYFGATISMKSPDVYGPPTDYYLVISDRNLYVFTAKADVVRCASLSKIVDIHVPINYDKCPFIGIRLFPHQHDIVLSFKDVNKIGDIIAGVYQGIANKPIKYITSSSTCTTIESFIKENKYHMVASAEYKLVALSPTPKSKLKVALDLYQKDNGVAYTKGAGKAARSNKSPSSDKHHKEKVVADDPLSRLLVRLKFEKYIPILRKQHADIDLISCMDETDLATFGITDNEHCTTILAAVKKREAEGSPEERSLEPTRGEAKESSPGKPSISLSDDDDLEVTFKMNEITLDSDDDDLMPIKVEESESPLASRSPQQTTVLLDDSDDDLLVPPKPATVALDSDDDL